MDNRNKDIVVISHFWGKIYDYYFQLVAQLHRHSNEEVKRYNLTRERHLSRGFMALSKVHNPFFECNLIIATARDCDCHLGEMKDGKSAYLNYCILSTWKCLNRSLPKINL